MRTRAQLLLTLGAVCLVAAGCGGDGDGSEAPPSPEGELIGPADVDAQPAGSPERAALEYLQAIQFKDVTAVLDLYTEQAQPNSRTLEDELVEIGGALGGVPEIVETDVAGDEASVLLKSIRGGQVVGMTIRLEMDGQDWLVSDHRPVELAVTQARLQRERTAQRG